MKRRLELEGRHLRIFPYYKLRVWRLTFYIGWLDLIAVPLVIYVLGMNHYGWPALY